MFTHTSHEYLRESYFYNQPSKVRRRLSPLALFEPIRFQKATETLHVQELSVVSSQLRPRSVFVILPGLVKPRGSDPRGASILDGINGYTHSQRLSVGG